ncbi:glycosyl hydrolase [Mycolicibacterium sp. 050158]|uniref:glycosyl hydrolase n=1 Tax=Mycolicibacterium sp. 050158 TaxID=3090602 RepID=UPI00299F22E5|nr:glycosyl hydrolase [Mycolicibacterium sp. 050158]MDX1891572.1 cellulase family glycosylhydrolase [Mycolicibacterium sp. 050158]
MKNIAKGMLKDLATRGVIAAIPVAMVSAYASGVFVQPPRLATLEYAPVAEIVNSPTTVGVAESPLYGASQAAIDTQLDDLVSIGVTNIRVFVPWGLIEQSPGAYDWSYLDRVMTAAAARNMGVMAEINATPTWAGPNPGSPGFPPGSDTPNVAAFSSFLQTFVSKYKTTVSAYEIWNEPNYIQFSNPINPEAYAQLLMAAYPIIKNAVTGDPTATVVAGAVGATQNGLFTMDPVTFVQRMLAAGAANYFDALSFHPYNDQIPFSGDCPTCGANILTPREQLDQIKALIGTAKSIWISEYGVSTPNGQADYAQQSAWIKDLLDSWQTYGQAGPVFLYTGADTATGSTDPEANYGLWTQNGTAKDVVAMLQAWIAAHQPPVTPTDPGPPVVNPVTAFFQAVAAQLQAFVNAIVSAIKNFFTAFAGPQAPAATVTTQTLAAKVASVATPDSSVATAGVATDAATPATDGAKSTASKSASTETTNTETTAAAQPAAASTSTEPTAAEAVPTAAEATVTPTVPTAVTPVSAPTDTPTTPVASAAPATPVASSPTSSPAEATSPTAASTASTKGTSSAANASGSASSSSSSSSTSSDKPAGTTKDSGPAGTSASDGKASNSVEPSRPRVHQGTNGSGSDAAASTTAKESVGAGTSGGSTTG